MSGVAEAGRYLLTLLERPGPYRQRWERVASRVSGTRVNMDAVSRVIAAHRSQRDPTGADYRSLNDTIRRALTGRVLTMGTLTEFIESFDITPSDASHLRDLLRGTAIARIIIGDAMPPVGLYEKIGKRKHQTIALNELHQVGPDRLPMRHRTIQTIRVVDDEMDHYPYSFDTNAATISVIRGGEVGRLYRVTDDWFAVDIQFGRTLTKGETATFEYETTFDYAEPPPPEFRRGIFGQLDAILIEVRFHPSAVPADVWWAEWADLSHDSVKKREKVDLDHHHSVHSHHEQVHQAIVGFYWDW
jgi:hypothetical protein